jgi:uncharacterized protein (DUF885 family)
VTDIYELSTQYVDDVVSQAPELATYLGVPGSDHLWSDTSPAGTEALHELVKNYRRQVNSLNGIDDRWHQHGRRVFADHLEENLSEYETGSRYYRARHVAGIADDLRDIFDLMSTQSDEDWDNIATRLETIDQPMNGWEQTLEEGRRLGHVVSQRQVTSLIEQMRHLAGSESKFLGLAVASAKSGRADRVAKAVDQARNSAGTFADYLEQEYATDAVEADGVGAERYVSEADRFLGMTIDPQETYEWGWTEVHRLHRAMTDVAQRIDRDRSLAEVLKMLDSDPRFLTSNPEEFVEFIQELQDQALGQLDGTHFDVPEQIRKVSVNLVPPGAALGAYYLPPSEDFTRPGGIWYSFGERQQLPLWGEVSTGYHEGFPGHHLQVGTAMSQSEKLSRAHRVFIWHPGYGEGWALYTERLMDELGYFEEPQYLLGMLAAQQLRACRVVIDIGSHLDLDIPSDGYINPGGKWNFDAGVQTLHQIAGLPIDQAESETKRYLGWPGQAIAYKVGERAILRMREEAKRKEGGDFDLKDFHRRLLEGGDVRLDYLAESVSPPEGGSGP